MRISIDHKTKYTYGGQSNYAVHALRLTPPNFQGQRVIEWRVTAPGMETAVLFRDGFGNLVHLVSTYYDEPECIITARGIVETEDNSGIVKGLVEPARRRVYLRSTPLTEASDGIRDLVASDGVGGSIEGLHNLMDIIRDKVDYQTGTTESGTTAQQALEAGQGVCQDHAHIFIAAARELDIPARYINGYMCALPEETDEASEAHHAWAEVWIDSLGWVGFDPANKMCPNDSYVRLATGLDATYAAPIRGVRVGHGDAELSVVVDVQPTTGQSQQQSQGTQ